MNHSDAPSGEVESALALTPGDAGPSNDLLEAMAREESWLQVVRGDGSGPCFDGAALDVAKGAIDVVKAQADSHNQAIDKECERFEALGGRLCEAIACHCREERNAAATPERLLKEAATVLEDAKGKLATADTRAGELLLEKEKHQRQVEALGVAR